LTTPSYNGTSYVTIGGDTLNGASRPMFAGSLDDFGFFNGKVLTQSEITTLYSDGASSAFFQFL